METLFRPNESLGVLEERNPSSMRVLKRERMLLRILMLET